MRTATRSRSTCIRAAAVLFLCGLAASSVFAGSIERVLGADDVATARKVDLSLMSGGNGSPKGIGPVAYLPALGAPPKRVALVSFYVWDTGNLKKSTYVGYNFIGFTKFAAAVDADTLQSIPTRLFEEGITPLTDTFAAYGMQLLTPAEFLDTKKKRADYESFRLESSGFVAGLTTFFTKKAGPGKEGEGRSPSKEAAGFRLLELPTGSSTSKARFERGMTWRLAAQGGDGKLFQGLGYDLSTALGVDAVMIIYNVLQAEKTSIRILGTYAYMFGPNPVHAGDTAMVWTGHQYSGAYLWIDAPLVTTDKQGRETESDFPGYAHVVRALGIATGDYLKKRTEAN